MGYNMCFITNSFIKKTRYEMGSLDFSIEDKSQLSQLLFHQVVVYILLTLKHITDVDIVNSHYNWVFNHWDKIERAFLHPKWKKCEEPYSELDVEINDFFYTNRHIVTNIFCDDYSNLYFDGQIHIDKLDNLKHPENPFEVVDTDKGSLVFTKEYLTKTRTHGHFDIDQAIARCINLCVNTKNNKYISYIIYKNGKTVYDINVCNAVKEHIEKLVTTEILDEATNEIEFALKVSALNYIFTKNRPHNM